MPRRDDETWPGEYAPGDYGKSRGNWFVRLPLPFIGQLADISDRDITENEDGTITVTGLEIRNTNGDVTYSGDIVNGEWTPS